MAPGATELVWIGIGLALVVLWLIGVVKLFTKGHPTLGIVAIVGLLFPLVALVGYAGWFVEDRSTADTF